MTAPKSARKPKKTVESRTNPDESGNVAAIRRTVEYLRGQGWLGPEDEALIEIVFSLALQVDKNPENALLWKQYAAAEAQIRRKVKDAADDKLDELLRELSAPMGNTSKSKA